MVKNGLAQKKRLQPERMNTEVIEKEGTSPQEHLFSVYKNESEVLGVPIPDRIYCSENCQYGVPFVAAKYCGFDEPPNIRVKGEWQHGWHPPEHNVHPELVIGSNGLSLLTCHKKRFWVARKDQADYLKSAGYRKVAAIGMPIIYLPKIEVAREKDSLLVMPVHSLASTTHNWDFEKYADEINLIKNNFSRVVACIHPDCIAKNYWAPSLTARGIPIISGAHLKDRNSLLRMALLFSRFEFVTTNGFGSHLVYSAFFGAKPSIFGSLAKYSKVDFQKDLIYNNCPDLLSIVIRMTSEKYLRQVYGNFFLNPWEADKKHQWAEFQLGLQHKCNPKQLRKIFNLKKRIIYQLRRFNKAVKLRPKLAGDAS